MKNKKRLIIVLCGLFLVVGVSFGYYMATARFVGDGANISASSGRGIEVIYDAGTSALNITSLVYILLVNHFQK